MAGSVEISVEEAVKVAVDLHKQGDLSEASIIYDEILKVAPDSADALHYKGLIQHQLGESETAVDLIARALALAPAYPGALNNLGNILREMGRLEDAQECYRQVLEMSPDHVDTLVNMGSVHNGLHEASEALEYVERAMAIDPEHAAAWNCLGNIYRDRGMPEEAKSAYQKSTELAPGNKKTFKELAKILYRAGDKKESIATLTRLLERNPDDEVARHMIAAFGGAEAPERASNRFVTQTFDSFSSNFDQSLARLDYKAPQLVADELRRVTASAGRELDILDIGCGTGLCGPLVKPLASVLIGVDLSSGMLRKAKLRDAYDALHLAELTEFMQQTTDTYDAIVCVDTFVYFGKLAEAFCAAESILKPGGHLVFTVERHSSDESSDDFWLRHHGRYSHSDEYIDRALSAADLSLQSLTPVIPRTERGEPVSGSLVVATLASGDSV